MSFERGLELVLRAEGGYVDDPDDRGGATNYGITQGTYDAWNESKGRPAAKVREITKLEVSAIYRERYWLEGRCDELLAPVSIAHFDACVNHGLKRAAILLQNAVGATPDGMIGPKTLAAVIAKGDALLEELLWTRARFYVKIATGSQVKFLRGWLLRIIHLRTELVT